MAASRTVCFRSPVDPELVREVAAVLGRGEVVVLPTDTVYGVAVAASVPKAARRLVEAKEREPAKPLAVLVADLDQAMELIERPDPVVRDLLATCWPGPLTAVLARAPSARSIDLGGDPATIGIRCPDHELVRAVAGVVGPLVTTSANRSGEPTPATAAGAAAGLARPVSLIVDGGTLDGLASTVVDLTAVPPRVLRAGAIPPARLDLRPPGTQH